MTGEGAGEAEEGGVDEGLGDGEVGVEDVVLGDEAHVALHGAGEGPAVVGYGARELAAQAAAECSEKGGLAGPRRPHHGQHFAGEDRPGHAFQDFPLVRIDLDSIDYIFELHKAST